ncbi:hypothetical protein C8R46DRAFT_1089285 [Mycena filopes]|nr:hypothetical protein C8R46DRAFT_1089285 [Mycena filopes]
MFAFRLFSLLSLGASALAVDVVGKLHWNAECPDIKALGSAKVVLDAGKLHGNVVRDGSFSIPDVPAGTYILSVVSHDHVFDQLRIDVLDSAFEARPYSGMFQNPMMLMLLVGGVMVMSMPYLMKNMDPETMKDFREQQAKMSQMQSAMAGGDLKAGFSALMADDPTPAAPKALPASSAGGKKNKNKKR